MSILSAIWVVVDSESPREEKISIGAPHLFFDIRTLGQPALKLTLHVERHAPEVCKPTTFNRAICFGLASEVEMKVPHILQVEYIEVRTCISGNRCRATSVTSPRAKRVDSIADCSVMPVSYRTRGLGIPSGDVYFPCFEVCWLWNSKWKILSDFMLRFLYVLNVPAFRLKVRSQWWYRTKEKVICNPMCYNRAKSYY